MSWTIYDTPKGMSLLIDALNDAAVAMLAELVESGRICGRRSGVSQRRYMELDLWTRIVIVVVVNLIPI